MDNAHTLFWVGLQGLSPDPTSEAQYDSLKPFTSLLKIDSNCKGKYLVNSLSKSIFRFMLICLYFVSKF